MALKSLFLFACKVVSFLYIFQRDDNILLLSGKWYDMSRSRTEIMDATLRRLAINLSKTSVSATKKTRGVPLAPPAVTVWFAGEAIDSSTATNAEWATGMTFNIGSVNFIVLSNPPEIEELSAFPRRNILVGYRVIAQCR